MNVPPRFAAAVLSAALITAFSQAQTMPYTEPKSISVHGAFENGSPGSIIDNDLQDGYFFGADLSGGPGNLVPTGPSGSAFVQWGESSGSDFSDALWYAPYFNGGVSPEETFTLGTLTYRNGTLVTGTPSSVELKLTLGLPGISLPYGLNPIIITQTFQIGGAENLVFLTDTLVPTSYTDEEGTPYFLEIAFQQNPPVDSLSDPGFIEGENFSRQGLLTARFTAVPEPAAAVLGAVGVLLLLGRRKLA